MVMVIDCNLRKTEDSAEVTILTKLGTIQLLSRHILQSREQKQKENRLSKT